MAHHISEQAAIFSPSVARVAASTARDWSYIDSWLSSLLPGTTIPQFERNADTLKALLALAAANEQATDERELLSRAEASALAQIQEDEAAAKAESNVTADKVTQRQLKDAILTAVEDELPAEGEAELAALAATATTLGIAQPDAETICRRMLSLQTSIFEMEQIEARIDTLQRHLEEELAANETVLEELQGDDYKPAEDLPKQNLKLQRSVKSAAAQMSDLQDRVAALGASTDSKHPTVEDIARDEEEYLGLLARKKELDKQLAEFQGLPSDPDRARAELEGLRRQLRGLTSQRDEVFEGLVEQASPVKRR